MKKLFGKNVIAPNYNVEFDINSTDFSIVVSFKITKLSLGAWNTNLDFSSSDFRKNTGLWEYDVFEVFLQSRPGEKSISKPYLELEVSPAKQEFALWVLDPRKVLATPLDSQFDYTMEITGQIWKGRVIIPIENDFFKYSQFYAGVFSCLGKEREHFCHHQVEMEKVDFHRPDLFFKVEK